MEEKRYPIYRFAGTYTQPDGKPGHVFYSYAMFHSKLTEEQLKEECAGRVERGLEKYGATLKVTGEFKEEEAWCLTWFSHYTLTKFDDECDARFSFAQFVDRKRDDPNYCLMGAEDNWRWELCSCGGCARRGITAFNH